MRADEILFRSVLRGPYDVVRTADGRYNIMSDDKLICTLEHKPTAELFASAYMVFEEIVDLRAESANKSSEIEALDLELKDARRELQKETDVEGISRLERQVGELYEKLEIERREKDRWYKLYMNIAEELEELQKHLQIGIPKGE